MRTREKKGINSYGEQVSTNNLITYAADVMNYCSDKASLTKALVWIKKANQDEESMGSCYTYAAILYKLGDKDAAIAQMEKSFTLAEGDSKDQIAELVVKMKKGEAVWPN